MTRSTQTPSAGAYRWLLFLYSVPARPVSNRVMVWRRLMKAGAVSLKGAVYILPFTAEHQELLHWLVAEIKAMGGGADMVSIHGIDTLTEDEIVELFNQARRKDYLAVEREAEEVSRRLDNIKKGGQGHNLKGLASQLDKVAKACAEVRKTDFFATREGLALLAAIERMQEDLARLSGPRARAATVIPPRVAADYRGRTWATRQRPFVDRMACAWLIRHAIDPEATFAFIDEAQLGSLPEGGIAFDMPGAEFTHVGELCTFEVLLRAFNLKEKALWRLAEAVHDLDMKDGKHQSSEAAGIEQILAGIRKTAPDDQTALSRGMEVFALLYASRK
ncbi:MAG: chromate resistance protein ChrB domain-containing protein [Thermodesulfobacteriota bacterium]